MEGVGPDTADQDAVLRKLDHLKRQILFDEQLRREDESGATDAQFHAGGQHPIQSPRRVHGTVVERERKRRVRDQPQLRSDDAYERPHAVRHPAQGSRGSTKQHAPGPVAAAQLFEAHALLRFAADQHEWRRLLRDEPGRHERGDDEPTQQ